MVRDDRSDRGLSSAGRASALQAEGRRFDPDRLHHSREIGVERLAGVLDIQEEDKVCRSRVARSACSDDKVKRRRVLRDRVKRAPCCALRMRFRLERRAGGFIALRVDTGVPEAVGYLETGM